MVATSSFAFRPAYMDPQFQRRRKIEQWRDENETYQPQYDGPTKPGTEVPDPQGLNRRIVVD